MNIERVTCCESYQFGPSQYFHVDTADLSPEEFAEMRLLIDRLGLLLPHPIAAESYPTGDVVSIIVDTLSGEAYVAHFSSESLTEEANELIEFLKYQHRMRTRVLRPTG